MARLNSTYGLIFPVMSCLRKVLVGPYAGFRR